jgi:hypothetical protein
MKKLDFLKLYMATMIMAISTLLVGCVDDNDTEAPFLTVTPTSLTFNGDGNATDDSQNFIEISTNRQWTATSNKTWLTLSQNEGEGDAKIYLSVPAGTNDEATITIQISNKVGALAQEFVTVKAGSASTFESEVIYNTTVGTTSVSSPYPYVDKYEDWNATGTGASTVTYTGYNATVRASGTGNLGAYDGASGPNVVFFGANNPYFVINNITMPASKDFKLTFGAQYSLQVSTRATYDNLFKKDQFIVSLSADGTTWTPIEYSVTDGDQASPWWVVGTANFSLENEVSALYIKFAASVGSAFRLDDITLSTSSQAGTTVNLAGGSTDNPSTGGATATTIPDLIKMIVANGTTATVISSTSDYTFEGIVQNDTVGGNYTTNDLLLVTPGATTANNGVMIYGSQAEPTTIKVNKGDRIKVTLKAGLAKTQLYNGVYEITGSKTDSWFEFEKVSTGNTVTPITVTADKLIDYQNMTVTVANATSSEAGTWCTSSAAGTHTFSAAGTSLTVYVKKAATAFVDQTYKATTGSITGIVTLYSSKAQLAPRDLSDVSAFAGSSSGNDNNSGSDNGSGSTGSGTPTISLDMTSADTYPSEFPTTKTVDATTYKLGGYDFTFAGSSDAGFYYATAGYLMLGKTGAYIEFPAISGKKLVKAVFVSRNGASGNVTLTISDADGNIQTGGESKKWAQEDPYTYTYTLSGTKADTKYRLNVTNKYNAQITKLELYYE